MITQDMIDVSLQQQRIVHIRIDLLDFNFNKVDELSGNTISLPDISIDANSDIRRTCQIDLVVTDSSFAIEQGSKIWIDKYIQVYIGIENIHDNDNIVWMNQGIYLINQPTLKYDSTSHNLSFQGVDLMAKLTGMRNGYIEGITYVIPANTFIPNVVRSTLALGGFNNSVIEMELEHEMTPNELRFDIGATLYDILSTLRDIYGFYQIYFDVDGIFHFEKIPQDSSELIADDYIFDNTCISMTENVDFESVKNVIEVLGKTHDVKYYASSYSVSSGIITLSSSETVTLADGILIGFTTGNTDITYSSGLKINFNLTGNWEITDDYGNAIKTLPKNQYLVFKYHEHTSSYGHYQYMGFLQSYGYAEDDNPDSPFCVSGTTGRIRKVLSGGEYDNIYTNILAQERAEYELYLSSRLNDTIIIECVPLYYLDVQQLISITLPNSSVPNIYRIQTISTGDTQTINASRFYESA